MQANQPLVALLTTAALAAGVGLAGCSDDGIAAGPGPTPPASSASISASPSPSESAQPESPEDFIRRWVEAGTRMQNTGDTLEYRTLIAPCVSCNQFTDRVAQYYRRGGFIETDGWLVISMDQEPGSTHAEPVFVLNVDSRPTRYKESAREAVLRLPGGQTKFRVSLVRADGSWQVSELYELPT